MLSAKQNPIPESGEINSPEAKGFMGKIAVTIERGENSSPLSEVFGRSNFFLVYNTADNLEEILRNPFASELGGAGIQSVQIMIENNVDVVIVKQMGINSLRFLNSANIKVYRCNEGTAADAIRHFQSGELTLIESINEDFSFGGKRKRHRRNFKNNKNNDNRKGKI